ncbi:GDP-mannose 4,6-dehydratase [Terribacillus sp. AE2B 122]|uniref:GDP-mannose 4,6-dehydratase n=1 Tax=Terribacillus sp. AE2B 122 TaxID=1331902 RepID=UPI001440BD0D|nr:GDP-mannose 4,6-dehydratase [Terribacillus sp. AE2B 122]VVM33379.1 putative GDP-6-deoxy-D-lyxo-4-hexulose reductase [Terribacillus sp. AE2B 122]
MNILVTGSTGFVGQHITRELIKKEHKVYAGVRTKRDVSNTDTEEIIVDLENLSNFENTLKSLSIDCIFHLAAQGSVPSSWNAPSDTISRNILGTTKLMEITSKVSSGIKFVSVGSGEEYGLAAKYNQSLNEDIPCSPQNPYAISKYTVGLLGAKLAEKNNFNFVHLRSFNHYGPGQGLGYVVSDFCNQICQIENNNIPPIIKVGNIQAERDFQYIDDIIQKYVKVIESELPNGVYNVASNNAISIKYILDKLISYSKVPIEIEIDKSKFRPLDIKSFKGENKKLNGMIQYENLHQTNIEEGLLSTLNWWRERVGK